MSAVSFKDTELKIKDKTVISDLSFDLEEKSFLLILGKKGSGKTCILRSLMKCIRPSIGEISVADGIEVCEIGYMPQQNAPIRSFNSTVWEIIISSYKKERYKRNFILSKEKTAARAILDYMEMQNTRWLRFEDLPFSEQRKILFIRAVNICVKLLLLDEPMLKLENEIDKEKMYSLIRKKREEDGITVIMTSDDFNTSLDDVTHVLYLDKKPFFFGTKQAWIESEVYKQILEEENL